MTLVEGTQSRVAFRLQKRPNESYGIHTCPRWLNKELKFLLSTLHQSVLQGILELTEKTFREGSRKKAKVSWPRWFISILVLSMVTESLQVAVRCKEETDKGEGIVGLNDKSATITLKTMDERLDFMTKIFRQKYGMNGKGKDEFNPIEKIGDREHLDNLPSETLAMQVKALIDKYSKLQRDDWEARVVNFRPRHLSQITSRT